MYFRHAYAMLPTAQTDTKKGGKRKEKKGKEKKKTPPHYRKNFVSRMRAPCSSYCALVSQIFLNVSSDARIEPPTHAAFCRSVVAEI